MIGSAQGNLMDLLNTGDAVFINKHLVLTSGKHSDGYINLRKLAGKSRNLTAIGYNLCDLIHEQTKDTDYVKNSFILVGPETMGRSFAHETARALNEDEQITDYVWCEANADKTAMQWNSKMEFAGIVAGQHCIIVDDVLTTAKTLKQTVDLIRATGGIVEGAVVVVRRDPNVTAEIVGIPWISALCEVDLQSYEPDSCPLCQKKIPMMLHPGHGHEWIKDHPGYPTVN